MAIHATGGTKSEDEIPDIEGTILENSTLEITFIAPIEQGAEAKLAIPPDHWQHKQ